MRIETICDPGTAEYREDGLVFKMIEGFAGPSILAGVVDGVSGLYDPSQGPQLFDGKTGGQGV